MTQDEIFMRRAIALGHRAAFEEKSGGPFGAVVVKDNQIIGEGYNQVLTRNDPTWHGEMQAIREACRTLGTPHLDGCFLYTSAECCPMCLSAAYWAHIKHIYFASTMADAFTYGAFADLDILSELKKEPTSRRISYTQLCHPEAIALWKAFAALPDRARY